MEMEPHAELNDELGFGAAHLLDAVLPAPDGPMTARESHAGFRFTVHRRLERIRTWSMASPKNAWILAAALVPLWVAAFALEALTATKTVRLPFPFFVVFLESFAMILGVSGSVTYAGRARRSTPQEREEAREKLRTG